jgi:hypothetical protein
LNLHLGSLPCTHLGNIHLCLLDGRTEETERVLSLWRLDNLWCFDLLDLFIFSVRTDNLGFSLGASHLLASQPSAPLPGTRFQSLLLVSALGAPKKPLNGSNFPGGTAASGLGAKCLPPSGLQVSGCGKWRESA